MTDIIYGVAVIVGIKENKQMNIIQLFECFNVEMPGGEYLWEVKYLKPEKASMKISKKAGEPGTTERIEKYRMMVASGQPLFE